MLVAWPLLILKSRARAARGLLSEAAQPSARPVTYASLSGMATSAPLRSTGPATTARASRTEPFLAHARQLEREHPEHLASLDMTAEAYAAGMVEPRLSLEEAEQAGWIAPEERRLYEGRATLEDLLANGFSDEQARTILQEQEQEQARACASST